MHAANPTTIFRMLACRGVENTARPAPMRSCIGRNILRWVALTCCDRRKIRREPHYDYPRRTPLRLTPGEPHYDYPRRTPLRLTPGEPHYDYPRRTPLRLTPDEPHQEKSRLVLRTFATNPTTIMRNFFFFWFCCFPNLCDKGLNLSGSWQQGHSATYNTPSRI